MPGRDADPIGEKPHPHAANAIALPAAADPERSAPTRFRATAANCSRRIARS